MAPRPSTRPCSSTVASTEPTSSRSTGIRGSSHGAPFDGATSVLGWRDGQGQTACAGTVTPGRHIDRTGHSRRPPSRVGIAPRRGCALSGRVSLAGHPARGVVSSYAFDVESRFRCTRTNSYEFVGVHNCGTLVAHNSGRLTLAEHKSPGQSCAPGRVRTCDPPLRRCPHRVRTRSSVSSQTPRPGLSPCQEPIGSGQTAHRTAHIIGT